MRLIDAPIGLFRFDGELVLKTEYQHLCGDKYTPDCFLVSSGEYFWGGVNTADEFNNLDVEPLDRVSTIQSQWIPVSERLPKEGVGVLISYHTQLAYRFVTEAIRRTDDTYYAYAYDCVIGGEKVDAWMPLPIAYKVTE